MNTYDIRNMSSNQGLFWLVSCCLTLGTVALASFLAFYGSNIVGKYECSSTAYAANHDQKHFLDGRQIEADPNDQSKGPS